MGTTREHELRLGEREALSSEGLDVTQSVYLDGKYVGDFHPMRDGPDLCDQYLFTLIARVDPEVVMRELEAKRQRPATGSGTDSGALPHGDEIISGA